MEVVLVTSRSGKRWVIPKGIIEPDLDPGPSAAKEAWEEAGVRGELSHEAIGSYRYRKWGRDCVVEVYLLRIEAVLDDWPESGWRKRVWLSATRAAERVEEEELAALLRVAPGQVSSTSWRSTSQVPIARRGSGKKRR
jgi:8-oxo-dGTP pyrophosphatase MutT (NUDIX family)